VMASACGRRALHDEVAAAGLDSRDPLGRVFAGSAGCFLLCVQRVGAQPQ
jgi:hypothetical protein